MTYTHTRRIAHGNDIRDLVDRAWPIFEKLHPSKDSLVEELLEQVGSNVSTSIFECSEGECKRGYALVQSYMRPSHFGGSLDCIWM